MPSTANNLSILCFVVKGSANPQSSSILPPPLTQAPYPHTPGTDTVDVGGGACAVGEGVRGAGHALGRRRSSGGQRPRDDHVEQKQSKEVQACRVSETLDQVLIEVKVVTVVVSAVCITAGGVVVVADVVVKNPVWNQKFRFNLDEPHHYLNICVWEKLRDERGDLLIGHVREYQLLLGGK